MKRFLIKCPLCGKVDSIEKSNNTYNCSYCNSTNLISECKIKNIDDENRELDYLLLALKRSVLANNKNLINKYIKIILEKDKSNPFALYLNGENDIVKKDILLNMNYDVNYYVFLIKKDISKIKKYSEEEKQSILNKLPEQEQFLIKQYLYNNEDDSNELYDTYKEISLKPIEYINLNKQRYIGYFLMILSLVISILISLICSLTVYEDCLYATTTVLGLLPSILLSLGITKALNFKKNWFALLIFIPVFYLLTYLMTIFFRDCSFIESFEVHFKHIISAVPDILDSITKHSDIEWGEKE